jgi:2-dehydropantoate 2-reductase
MRFVVLGAGAVGGVVGGRLHQHGHEVLVIARGEHLHEIRRAGLRIESPDEVVTLAVPAAERPAEVDWSDDDVVLLATKTQDTGAALTELAAAAPETVPVACAQNGVENELRTASRTSVRRFAGSRTCTACM